jgi:LmbE family N-acetylglucosaminyl deacetylase
MLSSYLKNKKVMVVVAHPDDELLGLGATMHRLINEAEIKTHVVILGEGITSRATERDAALWEKELATHKANINNAQKAIGYHNVSVYDFPDNRFDSVALLDIIKVIEHEKKLFVPDIIFTHHGGDLNVDHRRTFEAVMTACRPMENESVKAIITFETASGTEWRASTDPYNFIPNLFMPIDEAGLQAKITAMQSYEYEKRSYPHPRSPEALMIQAQRWGVAVGVRYAEAFCIVRSVDL